MIQLTDKQKEYTHNCNRRWNFKTGAVRSGKSYVDTACIIPERIIERIGKSGISAIIGVSKSTIERNVLQPMREIYGDRRIGTINSQNIATVFGENVYCLGAEKVNQVSKIQGASFKYVYGDEVAKWNVEVFDMLKSRLDKPYSCFDGSCNPESPTHWLKKFLDSNIDIYCQKYTIFDNDFLTKEFIDNLCTEYAGTVYYDRYILGLWKAAEGIIYTKIADKPQDFIIYEAPPILFATIGVDFGGNGSATAFNCTGFTVDMKEVITLKEYYHKGIMTPTELENDFIQFVKECKKYYIVADAYCDSAEQTLIRGLKVACANNGVGINIHNARKGEINDRIRFFCRLQGIRRHKIMYECTKTLEAFQTAVWDDKHPTKDVRLDDGTYNIDSLDAQEYAVEPYMKQIIDIW